MTLETYNSESFEELADRMVRISGKFREMAKVQRQLKSIKLNDRKLQDWFDYIEIWAQSASGRQQTEIVRQRGAERATKASKRKKG